MTTQPMINDTRSIVERKLSNIYTEVTITIPFNYYAQYVDEAYEILTNKDVPITKCEVSEHPDMMESFERKIRDWMEELDYDDLAYSSPPTAHIFKKELKEAERLLEIKRKEEEQKQREAEEAQRKLEAKLLEHIPVTKKNLPKALAILRAAGLTK